MFKMILFVCFLLSWILLPVVITTDATIEQEVPTSRRSARQGCGPLCQRKKTSADDDQLIRRLAPYVHMVYKENKTIDAWDCAYCGDLVKKPSKVYLITQNHDGYDERVIIPIDKRRKEIVVAFRGDMSSEMKRFLEIESFLHGKSAPLDWPQVVSRNLSINEIALAKFSLLFPQLHKTLSFLVKKYPGYAVYFVGHSYGGSLAILFGLHATLSKLVPNTTAVAIQPAKFAGSSLLEILKEHNVRTITVIDNDDVITRLPVYPEWTHLGELKKIESNVIYDCDPNKLSRFCKRLFLPVDLGLESMLVNGATYIHDHLKFFDIPFYFFKANYQYYMVELASIVSNEDSFLEKTDRAMKALDNLFMSLLE